VRSNTKDATDDVLQMVTPLMKWLAVQNRMIELWQQNNGPSFKEGERGLIHYLFK
jgi:hypothetical protein